MSARPIWLEAVRFAGGVTLRVVGCAMEAVEGSFSLETSIGSNRSVHHGTVALSANEEAILATVTAATGSTGDWQATLFVELVDASRYQQIERSSS